MYVYTHVHVLVSMIDFHLFCQVIVGDNNIPVNIKWLYHLILHVYDLIPMLQEQMFSSYYEFQWNCLTFASPSFPLFSSFSAAQCSYLTKKKHIYLLSNGRINVCGLNHGNIEYVAKAIHEAVTSIKD